MKTKKVNDHLSDYYNAQSLDEDKMRMLFQMSEKISQDTSKKIKGRFFNRDRFITRRYFLLVASLVFVVISIWGISNFEKNQSFNLSLTERISQEIALNHRKQLALDFQGKDYDRLNTAMNKLDFKMKESHRAILSGLELVGARYCSIQGNIAAQLRLRDKDGKYFSLYQTKLTELLKNKPESFQRENQVDIKQWQENGLFYGLAANLK